MTVVRVIMSKIRQAMPDVPDFYDTSKTERPSFLGSGVLLRMDVV